MEIQEAEKQVLIAVFWFGKHYAVLLGYEPSAEVSIEDLENFGEKWFYKLKEDWTPVISELTEKGFLEKVGDKVRLTEQGRILAEMLEKEGGIYAYEYDNFYPEASRSKAHADFCTEVYGHNLEQHGLAPKDELLLLTEKAAFKPSQTVLDLGSGSGLITDWLQKQTGAGFHGIDISSAAVRDANKRFSSNSQVSFSVGNMNTLSADKKYDAVISVDTLYYTENLRNTLEGVFTLLKPNGRFYAFFSAWIMEKSQDEYLKPELTGLGRMLTELGVSFESVNLTESGLNHWRKKYETLLRMKPDFEKEGFKRLWEYRTREAERYGNWFEGCYARHFYTISPKP